MIVTLGFPSPLKLDQRSRGVIIFKFRLLKEKLFPKPSPNILQLEVTSGCEMNCIMCPKSHYGDRWKEGEMDWKTFEGIIPSFSGLEYVHLQGWGEPLQHPDLMEMLAEVKESGTEVGFTTNGMKLTRKRSEDFVRLGVDRIGVSLDGSTAETYQSIRRGGDFERVVSNLERLKEVKEKLGSKKPQVIVLFIKMVENIDELPALVELASRLGANKVVATNLDCVSKPPDEKLRVFSREDSDAYQSLVDRAETLAQTEGILFLSYPLSPREVGVCSAEPLTTTYVSWEGQVGPCVNLNLPVANIDRVFWGEKGQLNTLTFGNVEDEELADIWNSEGYRRFRGYFERRRRSVADEPSIENPFSLMDFTPDEQGDGEVPPVPPSCRTCYKQYGF